MVHYPLVFLLVNSSFSPPPLSLYPLSEVPCLLSCIVSMFWLNMKYKKIKRREVKGWVNDRMRVSRTAMRKRRKEQQLCNNAIMKEEWKRKMKGDEEGEEKSKKENNNDGRIRRGELVTYHTFYFLFYSSDWRVTCKKEWNKNQGMKTGFWHTITRLMFVLLFVTKRKERERERENR